MDSRRSSPAAADAPCPLPPPTTPHSPRGSAGRGAPPRELRLPASPSPVGAARAGAVDARPAHPRRGLRRSSRTPHPQRPPPLCALGPHRRAPEGPLPPPRLWTWRSGPQVFRSPPAVSPSWRPALVVLGRLKAPLKPFSEAGLLAWGPPNFTSA